MDLEFSYDKQGFRKVETSIGHEVLGWFLEQDIQGCIEDCEELLQTCDKIEKGVSDSWKGTGNAHTIIVTKDNVTIVTEFAIPETSCSISLQEFQMAIKKWQDFISRES